MASLLDELKQLKIKKNIFTNIQSS